MLLCAIMGVQSCNWCASVAPVIVTINLVNYGIDGSCLLNDLSYPVVVRVERETNGHVKRIRAYDGHCEALIGFETNLVIWMAALETELN